MSLLNDRKWPIADYQSFVFRTIEWPLCPQKQTLADEGFLVPALERESLTLE